MGGSETQWYYQFREGSRRQSRPIIGSLPVNGHVYFWKALNFVIQVVALKIDDDVLMGTDLLELLGAFKIEVKNGSFHLQPLSPLDLSAEVHLPHAISLVS